MKDLATGLADPVHDAQRLFRGLLEATSRPGRIVELVDAPAALPGVSPAAVGCLLALADRDTPLWLAPAFDRDAVREYLRFHTGAPLTGDRGAATFALLDHGDATVDGFAVGTDAYPDRSATLVVVVPALDAGRRRTWRGPGIDGACLVGVDGLDEGFWQAWAANHALFPCGVDVLFVEGRRLAALPRSIAVEI
jgi:alpha-D-ribose 1-methylphosphonate 5-triphosphate synthase subunit PhnH